jgi:AhpD family alkylhydroperoxidase
MQPRIDTQRVAPGAFQPLLALEEYIRKSSHFEKPLLHLVRMRASQLNGCAYCLDMHSKDARAEGESEQRLYGLNAWRETPFYTDRERAALAWTEAVTLVSRDHVPDSEYDAARQYFSEEEMVNLTLAIASINSWNRLCISFRVVPGAYRPKHVEPEVAAGVR